MIAARPWLLHPHPVGGRGSGGILPGGVHDAETVLAPAALLPLAPPPTLNAMLTEHAELLPLTGVGVATVTVPPTQGQMICAFVFFAAHSGGGSPFGHIRTASSAELIDSFATAVVELSTPTRPPAAARLNTPVAIAGGGGRGGRGDGGGTPAPARSPLRSSDSRLLSLLNAFGRRYRNFSLGRLYTASGTVPENEFPSTARYTRLDRRPRGGSVPVRLLFDTLSTARDADWNGGSVPDRPFPSRLMPKRLGQPLTNVDGIVPVRFWFEASK